MKAALPPSVIMSASPVIRPTQAGVFPIVAPGVYEVALGNASQFRLAVYDNQGSGIFCGVIGRGCYLFTHSPSPEYVAEKLAVYPGDAENLADFIACQFGEAPEPFGHYNPHLCA